MRTSKRALILLALLALGVLPGVSRATRGIGVATGERLVTYSSERVVFQTEFVRVTCPITLTATMLGGAEKVDGRKLGEVTRASLPSSSCTGGTATVLTETLPWTMVYRSFTGTLPNISSVTVGIEKFASLVSGSGIGCLAEGTLRGTTGTSAEVTQLRLDETVRVPIVRNLSGFCPSTGTVSGTLRTSPTLRLSLMEALGATLSPSTSGLTIPAGNANGTIVFTAVGGPVTISDATAQADVNRPPFTISGCGRNTQFAMAGAQCTMTVTPGQRPTSGTVIVRYINEQRLELQVAISIIIN